MNLPRSLWFDLGTSRIILLRSPTLGSEQALASISDRRQLKKQLLEAASQILDDEDDTILESSSPNYRTHPKAFHDSQDPYDI